MNRLTASGNPESWRETVHSHHTQKDARLGSLSVILFELNSVDHRPGMMAGLPWKSRAITPREGVLQRISGCTIINPSDTF
jgi:hypothetical protein